MGRRNSKQPQNGSSCAGRASQPSGSAGGVCEALENRVLLSQVGTPVDAGDQRWLYVDNRAEKLLRATDEVLVGFVPSSAARIRRLSSALTGVNGALAGYGFVSTYEGYNVLFRRTARGPAPSLETLQQHSAGFPGIKHLSPTFFNVPDYRRLVVFDILYVDLANGVAPSTVFAKGFSGFQVASVSQNAFHGTLRRGGAIDALRVAETLRHSSLVESVEASFAADVVLASTTANGKDFGHQWSISTINVSDAQQADAWDRTTGSE